MQLNQLRKLPFLPSLILFSHCYSRLAVVTSVRNLSRLMHIKFLKYIVIEFSRRSLSLPLERITEKCSSLEMYLCAQWKEISRVKMFRAENCKSPLTRASIRLYIQISFVESSRPFLIPVSYLRGFN